LFIFATYNISELFFTKKIFFMLRRKFTLLVAIFLVIIMGSCSILDNPTKIKKYAKINTSEGSFIIGLYALHRLAMVKEVGEVEEKIVAQELFSEVRTQVRTLSSVDGVKQMISFPIVVLKNITERIVPNAKQ
jgi:hypothetical protein